MSKPDIPERWLRNVWRRQSFDHSRLATTDGRHLQILFPGLPNEDEGPDFLRARIRIGPTLYRGDVEIHRTPSVWTSHRHHLDPHYNSVILHVVLNVSATRGRPVQTSSGRLLPTLVLSPLLSGSNQRFVPDPADAPSSPPCSRRTGHTGVPPIVPWLLDLAVQRLELRIASFHARLVAHALETCASPADCALGGDTWDQLLYEGILEGLGYAKNQDSFLTLARNLRLATLKQFGLTDTFTIMSLLFGAAGLLPRPQSISNPESRRFLRALQRRWNDLRPSLRIPLLTPGDWLAFRLRPANFPTARIAAICLALPNLFTHHAAERLVNLMTAPLPVRRRARNLGALLTIQPDGFWKNHLTFGSPSRSGAAIGRSRALEIIINTMIPLGILLSRQNAGTAAERELLELYLGLPAPSTYRVTGRLLSIIPPIGAAITQAPVAQGMLQLEKYYCRTRRCSACVIGWRVGIRSSAASSWPRGRGCCSESNGIRGNSGVE